MKLKPLDVTYLQRKVKSLARLSTLPHVAAKVTELVEDPKTSASTLAKIISSDQVLAARILRLANSAYYGFPRKISTVNLAIVVLGFNALRDLVLSIAVIDQFSGKQPPRVDMNQFWRHALVVGMGARVLSRLSGYPVPGESFVTGLLHDIGYLVLLQHFPKYFAQIQQEAERAQCPLRTAELKTMKVSHAEIGAWLAEGWNLPEKIVQAVRHHHTPDKALHYQDLSWIIHLADGISYTIGEGNGLGQESEIDPASIEEILQNQFKLHWPLSFFQKKFREEAEKVDDFFALLSDSSKENRTVEAI